MTKYKVLVHKVLEDGTQIEIANVFDHPWYVAPVLKALARQIHEPAPPVNFEGQLGLDVA